jgi:hypothetical protein
MSTASASTPPLPKRVRTRLAAAARAQVAQLSDQRLAALLGDETEELADQLARQVAVPYGAALRAVRKALRQARDERLGQPPAVSSGTPPNCSLRLEGGQQAYVQRKAATYGSRAAVLKAALALLMQADP